VRGIYPRRWDSTQAAATEPKTLGEHLKKRRLELHLFQKDVAKLIGAHAGVNTGFGNPLPNTRA
jgi:hypothetical protein